MCFTNYSRDLRRWERGGKIWEGPVKLLPRLGEKLLRQTHATPSEAAITSVLSWMETGANVGIAAVGGKTSGRPSFTRWISHNRSTFRSMFTSCFASQAVSLCTCAAFSSRCLCVELLLWPFARLSAFIYPPRSGTLVQLNNYLSESVLLF